VFVGLRGSKKAEIACNCHFPHHKPTALPLRPLAIYHVCRGCFFLLYFEFHFFFLYYFILFFRCRRFRTLLKDSALKFKLHFARRVADKNSFYFIATAATKMLIS